MTSVPHYPDFGPPGHEFDEEQDVDEAPRLLRDALVGYWVVALVVVVAVTLTGAELGRYAAGMAFAGVFSLFLASVGVMARSSLQLSGVRDDRPDLLGLQGIASHRHYRHISSVGFVLGLVCLGTAIVTGLLAAAL